MDIETELLKLLSMKHFTKTPRPKVGLTKLAEALGRLGVQGVTAPALVEPLLALKGRGFAQTDPKIILKEEFPTAEFEIWPTPLGLSEVTKRTEHKEASAPTPQKPAAAQPSGAHPPGKPAAAPPASSHPPAGVGHPPAKAGGGGGGAAKPPAGPAKPGQPPHPPKK